MAGNNGGPWGGGGGRGEGGNGGGNDGGDRRPNGGRRPGNNEGPQIPEIDELMNKGREQLRVLMGGGNGGGQNGGTGGESFKPTRGMIGLGVLAALGLWLLNSAYTVQPDEQSVELFLGEYSSTGTPGLNFAPWPFVTYDVVNVTSERTENIGSAGSISNASGLMLTTDENVVDIGFQVVWTVNDPAKLLFNLSDPEQTVQAVSESVMREIIAASNLAPILNRDRGVIAQTAVEQIQETLDSYEAGISVRRVNLQRADPPSEVLDSFLAVQAAEQQRDRLQREADRYANERLASARGEATEIIEAAEGYRARVTNEALGQASRFLAILDEYRNAEDITRQRIYIETLEQIYADVGKVILDPSVAGGGDGGTGVVPFLPLNDLVRNSGPAAAATQGN